jgi:hypothetical protein
MSDRYELQRRSRNRRAVVRPDEPPTSLLDYKRRKDLEAYERRRAQICEARRQMQRRDPGPGSSMSLGWLCFYVAALGAMIALAVLKSCA